MIVKDRIRDYLHSLESSQGVLLDTIEEEALKAYVPIIKRETASLLRTMVAALKPAQILEIGTAVGYSALLMCQAMPRECHITTIEKYGKRIPVARGNFKKAGEESRITLLEGDADELLKELEGRNFDLVFMDAAKGQYLHWLPLLLKVMPVGAVLISDNVLQDGDIVESRFAVQRRNRTIHSRMREYLHTLKHMEELETAVIPIGDGVTISTRIK
ncbi:O-methyltransferase [Lachnoclostridium pacaense]|uniref:O-methyltransferase n=1 Tax=Enterocloster hominis (ex Hitch et al. 2024) TaxID=1917870 RepID=UPI001D117977|nr:O-methyltransferase [Lachnoclostridium pacaense]MCC2877832.1 O-methyltransferase [Lachnoclostridium pacaense]